MAKERLQKILSRAGYGSRRKCEILISEGRIIINGQIARLGTKADPEQDEIFVDGNLIRRPEKKIYIIINKPRGILSTLKSPDGRKTVRDLVSIKGHFYPVGRLDVDSEGLMILTNDGILANKLTHPRYGHEKEYRVLVARIPDEIQLENWRRGIVLQDGYRTKSAKVLLEKKFGKGAWLKIILREGRKRQIREVGSLIGLPVVKIIRTRIASITLGNLKPGEWRNMTYNEIKSLMEIVDLKSM